MKVNKCIFYLMRHAGTDWNEQGLIQGHTDMALSKIGAELTRAFLPNFKNMQCAHIFSSDLKRAKETALILSQNSSAKMQTTSELRSRCWGPWEGFSITELKQKFGDKFDTYGEGVIHPLPEVESYESAAKRVELFLHSLYNEHQGKNVLIITHCGVLKGLIQLLKLPQFADHRFGNLEIFPLESDGKCLKYHYPKT